MAVTSVSDAETGSTFTWGDTWNATGAGFTGTEPGWFVELAMIKTAPTAELRQVGFDVKSATAIEITPEAGTEIEPGDYPEAVLQIGFARDSDDGLSLRRRKSRSTSWWAPGLGGAVIAPPNHFGT